MRRHVYPLAVIVLFLIISLLIYAGGKLQVGGFGSLRNATIELGKRLDKLTDELNSLKSSIYALEAKSDSFSNRIGQLEETRGYVAGRSEDLTEKIYKLEAMCKEALQKSDTAMKKIELLAGEGKRPEREIIYGEGKGITDTTQRISKVELSQQELETDISNTRSLVYQLDNKLRGIDDKIRDIENRIRNVEIRSRAERSGR